MKILIIKLSSIGDLFHALPAVHNLKVELDAQIDWITTSPYVDLVNSFTDVDTVIPFYRHNFFSHFPKFISKLRASKYDMVIDLQGLLKSALVSRMAKAKNRIGPSFHREGSRFFYSAVAGKRNKDRHAVEENLDIIHHLGLNLIPPEFPVAFPKKVLSEPHPRVAICPASRWETKNLPTQSFIDIGNALLKQDSASIFLLGGPEDKEICSEIEERLEAKVTNLAGKLSLVETGSILQKMDLMISNDSGPLHMGVAAGVQTLSIYGPTDPKRTGPFGKIHKVIQADLECMPCFSRTCPSRDIACMTTLDPLTVIKATREMLSSC